MHKHVTQKYVPSILFFLVLILIGLFLYPYLYAILGSIVLAILFAPLYDILTKKIKNRSVSAGLICLIVVLVIFLPLLFIFQVAFTETTELFATDTFSDSILQVQTSLNAFFEEFVYVPIDFGFLLEKLVTIIGSFLQEFITGLPSKFLMGFVMLFLFYYLLKDGSRLIQSILKLFAVSDNRKKLLVKRFHDVTYGVVYGQVITAILQGLVATVGYIIFGVKLPLLFGLITIIFAFIPVFGTGIVWLPISLYFFTQGLYVQAVGLLLYGILIVGIIDNLVRPKLISGKTKLHPALVLLGVVSGLNMFGFLGLFIGPLLIMAGKELIQFYIDHNLLVKKSVQSQSKKSVKRVRKIKKSL